MESIKDVSLTIISENEVRLQIAQNAQKLLGTPFRLYGRNPKFGVDCVGLVWFAFTSVGVRLPELQELPEYRIRGSAFSTFASLTSHMGLRPVEGEIQVGDIVVVKPGPAQLHLMVAVSPIQFVHAHAGLRRVVALAPPIPWPTQHIFRFFTED